MPTEKTGEFFIDLLKQPSHADWRRLRRLFESQQDISSIYDISPHKNVWAKGLGWTRDPLWGALATLAVDRAETSAELVTQGTLAYVHADDVPYRVERYIPIDIYFEEMDSAPLVELREAVRDMFETLGFEYISYPAIAMSSARARGALKTRPMALKELEKTESLIATGLHRLNGKNGKGRTSEGHDLKAQKALLEVAKLQADIRLTEQETERSKAETKKAEAERGAAVMEKRSKLASILLKAVGFVGITIGTVAIAVGSPANQNDVPVAPPTAGQVIHTDTVERVTHLKKFGEFLEKLGEQEESDER